MLFTWPIPSKRRVNDYIRIIDRLNTERNYDAIVGTMFPPDVCLACSEFDHFILYELDSLINNPMYKEGLKKHLTFRLKTLERKLYKRAELIIHLNNNRKFYSKEEYKKYDNKTVYSDIPELKRNQLNKSIKVEHESVMNGMDDDQLLMVYSGHLSRQYRSPSELIELLRDLSNKCKIKCLFFSRGDCEDELRDAEVQTHGMIKRMGYVSQEELSAFTNKADFLLDIGNNLSDEDYSLPSKVICYMALGKPIIHLNGKNDSAIPYLEKYGLAINVEGHSINDNTVKKVFEFIKNNKGKTVDFFDLLAKFPQNTPEYTADLIINHIKNRV